MAGIIAGGVTALFLGAAWYIGAFTKPKARAGYFPGAHDFFYKEMQMPLAEIGGAFKKFWESI